MTKEEFLEINKKYEDIKKMAYETATVWMQHYQGENNTYGYKVGNLSITHDSIIFQFYHHDGIYPRNYNTIPLDFIFSPGDIKQHAESAKAEYHKKWEEDFKTENQIKELQNKLQLNRPLLICGTSLPQYRAS